jgi:Fe2+ transport system protein FeoA
MSLLRSHVESGDPGRAAGTTLAAARRDSTVRVARISGRPHLIQRLAALGVVPGVMLTVVKPDGPAIVSLGGARIAIGRNAADSIEIDLAEE